MKNYFDKWSVLTVESENKPPVKVYMRKASDEHVETYLWDVPKNPSPEKTESKAKDS